MLKEIEASGLRRYPVAVAEDLIEPGIRPLTDALYESGAHPLASCEGHTLITRRKRLDWLFPTIIRASHSSQTPSRPYVMFSASQSYARCLQRGFDHEIKNFFYNWSLRAHFVPGDYELAWMLEIADIRLIDQSIDLKKAQQDIQKLAVIVRKAAKTGGPDT